MTSQFEVGKTYSTRSAADYDTIYSFTILARTAKTVTVEVHGRQVRRGLQVHDGVEQFKPHGSYSMCAIIRADKPEVDATPETYAVTLEYNDTSYLVVPVVAGSVREAIDLAYQTDDWDRQRTYDACGDTFVGHVTKCADIETARRMGPREGEGLPIPLQDQEDCEQLAEVRKAAVTMLAALKDAENLLQMDRAAAVERRAVRERLLAAIAAADAAGITPKAEG
jgi:hypothetical protein